MSFSPALPDAVFLATAGGGLHVLDWVIIAGYFLAVIAVGRWKVKSARSPGGFFLADRKLGKLYQFFLNFSHSTEPQGAVSTASFVFQQGASGCWLAFQLVFVNPYLWFMKVWFRRVRLTTMADLFEDRFGSRRLGLLYALFQIVVVSVSIGFGNVVAYRIASSLAVKNEAAWTSTERQSVAEFHHYRQLESQESAGTLTPDLKPRLAELRESHVRGELRSYITLIDKSLFYVGFVVVAGLYIVLGGMPAVAGNQALQGGLIIVFSVLLIPLGLHSIGGWSALAERVPSHFFDLVSQGNATQFSVLNITAILLVSVVQLNGISHNMSLSGSARNEFDARSGVSGTYLKRLITIVWAFVGLIAVAYFGVNGLADPDDVWGELSHRLLGPGLTGLMLAGVIAGTMAIVGVKTLAVASLISCNVVRYFRPGSTGSQDVRAARYAVAIVLITGGTFAWFLGDFLSVANLALTVNLPFGAAVMLIFFWRRLTATAVWWSVILSILLILVVPWTAPLVRSLRTHPELVQTSLDHVGKPASIYFATVAREQSGDLSSPLTGRGRFNFECWLLSRAGFDVASLTPLQRFTAQFLFDALFPFFVMIIVSLMTRPTASSRVDFFYGKMKTPVGETPELETLALAQTQSAPNRFDHTKLFPSSNWEFAKWNRADAVGFSLCCLASAAIVGLFAGLLKLAA